MVDKSAEQRAVEAQREVECLGMKFPNDEARRKYFLEKLREKLKDPEFRKIEGFPIGTDEDILALSDPPYYTACPNPFLVDFINYYGHSDDLANLSQVTTVRLFRNVEVHLLAGDLSAFDVGNADADAIQA